MGFDELKEFEVDILANEHANLDSFPFRYGLHNKNNWKLKLFNCHNFEWQKHPIKFLITASFNGPNGIEQGRFVIFDNGYKNPKVGTVWREDKVSERLLSQYLRSAREEGRLTVYDLLNLHKLYVSGEANTLDKLARILYEKEEHPLKRAELEKAKLQAQEDVNLEVKKLQDEAKIETSRRIKANEIAKLAVDGLKEAENRITSQTGEIDELVETNNQLREEIKIIQEKVILQDVILQDNYMKIITDKGNFKSEIPHEDTERLALKALKLVGKSVEVSFLSAEQAYDGKFQDIQKNQETSVSLLPLQQSFTSKSSQKIFGPPGTGKTTKLISYVKDAVNRGVKPNNIAFISFSNGAATVAKKRVVEALPDYGTIEFPNFSTMHSLATRIGSESGKKLMVEEHFLAFDSSIECWREWTELGNPLGAVERYKHPILDTYNLAVAEQRSVDYSKIQLPKNQLDLLRISLVKRFPNLSGQKFEEYCKAYLNEFIAFKNTRRLITFDDVIEKVASDMFPKKLIPTFELLIIDEAQDLSNHLWKLASKLIKAAKTSYIAGDDDQAIMMGIGANPLSFVNYETSEPDMPLINSYRIPKLLRNYVDAGIMPELEKLPNRVGVTWEPNKKIGNLNSSIKKQKTNKKGESYEVQMPYSPSELINIIYQEYFQISDTINSDHDQTSISQNYTRNSNVLDWLIMAPTKGTGEKFSNALKEREIPHFYRNKPVLNATKDKTLIRVQTVHMSKGDEAKNSAIVVQTFGDVVMLAKDPRLSYVAVTRASETCYPNICTPGLLGDMTYAKNDFFGMCAEKYQKMFPLNLN